MLIRHILYLLVAGGKHTYILVSFWWRRVDCWWKGGLRPPVAFTVLCCHLVAEIYFVSTNYQLVHIIVENVCNHTEKGKTQSWPWLIDRHKQRSCVLYELYQSSIQNIIIYANGGCYFPRTRSVTRRASIPFHRLKAQRYTQEEEARTNKTQEVRNQTWIVIVDITKTF